ncbi:hypothetical protein CLAIMM_09416 [Cladophialophora immunda]|nr:hypothetical protein CLAIMM_09416 [Cladophialophora immunda]
MANSLWKVIYNDPTINSVPYFSYYWLLAHAMASDSQSASTPPLRPWESIMPWEIRIQIFTECIKKGSVSLLYVDKQHYTQFYPLLHEKFVLSFSIDPSATWPVVDALGHGFHQVYAASPHPDYSSIVEKMPVDQFRKIEILIDAPDPDNPGQLVQAWKQTTGLMAALLPRWKTTEEPTTEADIEIPKGRKTFKLPPMIVQFLGEEGKRWTSIHPSSLGKRIWNHSVPSYEDWDPETQTAPIDLDGIHSDVEIIMTAFLRVRGAASLTFQFPGEDQDCPEEVADLMEEVDRLSRKRTPFGLYRDRDFYFDDLTIGAEEDKFHLWLDYLLDDMDGPCAANLRLARFVEWCSEYDYLMGQRWWANYDLPDSLMCRMSDHYSDRFVAWILLRRERYCDKGPRSKNGLWPRDVSSSLRARSLLSHNRDSITCSQWSFPVVGVPDRPCNACKRIDIQKDCEMEGRYEEEQELLLGYMEANPSWFWDDDDNLYI